MTELSCFHSTEMTVVLVANYSTLLLVWWKSEEWGELQCCDVDPVIVRERSSGDDMEGGGSHCGKNPPLDAEDSTTTSTR